MANFSNLCILIAVIFDKISADVNETCHAITRYISQDEASIIDLILYNSGSFKPTQLTEIIGLCAAEAFQHTYPNTSNRVLVFCGPGFNGGEGLACARNLITFGYKPTIFFHKDLERFRYLEFQLRAQHVRFIQSPTAEKLNSDFDVIIDAYIGFNFKPPPRKSLRRFIKNLKQTTTPIFSIDVPSGWDVDFGPNENSFHPETLISIAVPKLGTKNFKGKHYLGGRFISKALQDRFLLNLPPFPMTQGFVCIRKDDMPTTEYPILDETFPPRYF